ncbi:MAG: DNA-deoxyinosine glycosylase [Eubacterium sp.]|nr:DNA-deoxyinosine glycosylase [Eubacterium sp.]
MKKNGIETHAVHEFGPVYDADSKILILGSFPSVKSREVQFYYGHPQNRFWKLLALLLQKKEPDGIEQKKEFLTKSHIAVWDVIESCDITGSSDSSIRNAKFNDLDQILRSADIKAIYANGKKAEQLYRKHILPLTGRDIIGLPSTSPANAAFTMERLIQGWKQILEKIECH